MLPYTTKHNPNNDTNVDLTGIRNNVPNSSRLVLFVSTLLVLLLLTSNAGPSLTSFNFYFIDKTDNNTRIPDPDPCLGRYIYMHRIPSRFNSDLLRNCTSLNKWIHMCKFLVNAGFGPALAHDFGDPNTFSNKGWFWTNQFSLEIIFHERMKRYECLTDTSSKASAVFVPYYAGLDVSRYLWSSNLTLRDAASVDLVTWLRSTTEWRSMQGMDHFLIAGRVAWDFRRPIDESADWGNQLMLLPESKNMTILTIEASNTPNSTDLGIPYPTWFHPSSREELRDWRELVKKKQRQYLFSFVGAPRPQISDSIRSELIDQCRASPKKCNLLLCEYGREKCDDPPGRITRVFQSSVFCLQPPGDTLTRRSTFDCMLAGCIPVFFHPGSAYLQYRWHFPEDHARYSVFIPMEGVKSGNVSVEDKLSEISEERVEEMREEVVGLIPMIVYADFGVEKEEGRFEDAFDLAVKGVLERVDGLREGLGGGL